MTEVYFTDVGPLLDRGRLERVLAMLSPERAGKARACRLERDRCLSAGVGYLLSLALARQGVSEVAAEYEYRELGKPYIKGYENIFFSLSHSGEMAMCAVSLGGEVGCDIEAPGRHSIEMAKRFFNPGEYRHIINSPDPEGEFIRLWTLKESYIKALGRGLCMQLSAFEIIPTLPPKLKGEGSVFFHEYRVGKGYIAALCTSGGVVSRPIFVNLEEV